MNSDPEWRVVNKFLTLVMFRWLTQGQACLSSPPGGNLPTKKKSVKSKMVAVWVITRPVVSKMRLPVTVNLQFKSENEFESRSQITILNLLGALLQIYDKQPFICIAEPPPPPSPTPPFSELYSSRRWAWKFLFTKQVWWPARTRQVEASIPGRMASTRERTVSRAKRETTLLKCWMSLRRHLFIVPWWPTCLISSW